MDKSPDAFRTISEVADELDLPQHVLRFWETRFSQIKPLKRGGGRRYYRPDDVDLLRGIRQLLYGEGYTIRGVQRILKEDGIRFVQSVGRGEQVVAPPGPAETGDGVSESISFEDDVVHDGDLAIAPAGLSLGQGRFETARMHHSGLSHLSDEDAERLKGALDELLECERLLTTLREPGEPPAE